MNNTTKVEDKPATKTIRATKAKGTKATKAEAPATTKAKATPAPVTILARELGISPKVLRAKLRRKGLKAPYPSVAKLRTALAD